MNYNNYSNKSRITVVFEKNGEYFFSKSFSSESFNKNKINSISTYQQGGKQYNIPVVKFMIDECLSVVDKFLLKKSDKMLWEITNLNFEQNPEVMQRSIDYFASKSDDYLTISFYCDNELIGSGSILLNNYVYESRKSIDVLGDRTEGGGENLYLKLVDVFESHMSDVDNNSVSVEEFYQVKNKFPKIVDHYKEMIQKKNQETKVEMSWF